MLALPLRIRNNQRLIAGTMHRAEYIALVGSFFLVGLEALIRILTLALRMSLMQSGCSSDHRQLQQSYHSVTGYQDGSSIGSGLQQKRNRSQRIRVSCLYALKLIILIIYADISTSIRNASDFVDLCALFGYYAEEHVVQTGDGYLLGLHRLAWRKGEESQKVNNGKNSIRKNVVYMHHGLLMNSEVWVCLTDEQRCLPFKLVEKGYDVWVSSVRGMFKGL
jgi:lysosomal acid lipase/cholesteryl ester hydrolase